MRYSPDFLYISFLIISCYGFTLNACNLDTAIQDRIKNLEGGLGTLKQVFIDEGVDAVAYNIVANEIHPTLNQNQLTYLERLVAELIVERGSPEVLLYLNFNSRKYFAHLTGSIKRQIDAQETRAEKLERLCHELKAVNQIPCEFDIAYSVKYPPLQQMLADWIVEEIHFMERTVEPTTPFALPEKTALKKDFKLEFDMSVSQFAFFIKSFIETGVIQNKNVSELIRFLAKFVKTKRSENISYESFRIKYYNVEDNTKDAVKNTLHTAIGFINRN